MRAYRFVCLSVVLLALAGCKKKEAPLEPGDFPPETVVVNVDGTAFTFADLNARAMGYLKFDRDYQGIFFASNMLSHAKETYRKRAINTFVYTTLMLNEAARLGITLSEKERITGLQKFAYALSLRQSNTNAYFNNGPHPPDVMRRDFDDSLRIEKLITKQVRQNIKVMDADVEAEVKEVEARNAAKRASLETVRQQILEGASFEDTARALSEHAASAKQGGDLGEFARGKYDPAFEEAAFSLPVGQVSEIVVSKAGYHLIKVAARNPAQAATADIPAVPETIRASHIMLKAFSVDRAKIADAIDLRKLAEGHRALYEELKAKAKIENAMFPDQEYTPLEGR